MICAKYNYFSIEHEVYVIRLNVQKFGHYGLGVDQHQKIDNYTMGLNSWKIALNERGDKKGVPGLSCFQPH